MKQRTKAKLAVAFVLGLAIGVVLFHAHNDQAKPETEQLPENYPTLDDNESEEQGFTCPDKASCINGQGLNIFKMPEMQNNRKAIKA